MALPDAPLTMQAAPSSPTFDADGRMVQGRHDLGVGVRSVGLAAGLILEFPPVEVEIWTPVPDLLDSGPFDRHFVVDLDNDGAAAIRFGVATSGARPARPHVVWGKRVCVSVDLGGLPIFKT